MDDPLDDPIIRIIYDNYESWENRDMWLAWVRASWNTEPPDSEDPVHQA